MKTLLLLRHAKSSWSDPTLPDHLRPLNQRGRTAAPLMGRLIDRQSLWPDLILCSTAVRAKQTCELITHDWNRTIAQKFLDELYHCPADEFTDILQTITEESERVMIIGHNPGLAEFLADVAGVADKFPTAALAELIIAANRWADILPHQPMKLQNLWRPRDLD